MKRNKLTGKNILLTAFAVLLLSGCGNNIPGDVIQPSAMENLLYDYHIATVLGAELPNSENYKKQAYISYVFEKHHVTEAEFDSSLVWYTRHGNELSAIYDNLKKRLDADSERMKQIASLQDGELTVSMSGDTVNIWQDRSLYWLTSSPYTNKVLFELKTDTSFKVKDELAFEADLSFLPREKSVGKAVMSMKVTFDNDSVQDVTRVMERSGHQRLYLRPDSAFEYKSVSGFIYYMKDSCLRGDLLVSDIRLVRTHPKTSERISASRPVPQDSTEQMPDRTLIRQR